jgi:hypothetical protein
VLRPERQNAMTVASWWKVRAARAFRRAFRFRLERSLAKAPETTTSRSFVAGTDIPTLWAPSPERLSAPCSQRRAAAGPGERTRPTTRDARSAELLGNDVRDELGVTWAQSAPVAERERRKRGRWELGFEAPELGSTRGKHKSQILQARVVTD